MNPPTASIASRRVVSTVPLPIPPFKTSSARKFAPLRSKSLSSPPLLILLVLSTILILYALMPHLTFSLCTLRNPSPLSSPTALIPSLQRWTYPHFASSNLAIYIYPLPPRFNEDLVLKSIQSPGPIRDPRCDTNFYSAEVHIHRHLLQSPVRVTDPSLAHLFYVPVYTTCDLITHQPNDIPRVGRHFAEAMQIVVRQFPYWNYSAGRDHIFMFAQGFAGRLAGDWQLYKNAIFMVHNGEFTALEYTPHKDFTVPPELRAYLTPYWMEDEQAALHAPRKYLAQFGGQVLNTSISDHRGSNYSGGVRQYIEQHFADHPQYRITGVRSDTYIADMKNSVFCLAPEGWHPWSPRPYYAVLMGCVPVIISEVQELAFEDLVNWDSFTVWVRPSDIDQLDSILRSFTLADLNRRRAEMSTMWRAFWYADNGLAYQAILRSLYNRRFSSRPLRNFSSAVQHI